MINWFPGHMAKTKRLIVENIKLADVVVELIDARVPNSSRNPLLNDIIGEKPRLVILTKEDLADKNATALWKEYYKQQGAAALSCNFLRGNKNIKKEILGAVRLQAKEILEKRARKGIIKKSVRTMVVGIPNVGKSTLINFLAGKTAAETGDKPGVTRGKQWIRLDKDVELLDMPGMLWPKLDDQEVSCKLAATGAISDLVFDQVELVLWLIEWLLTNAAGSLAARYKIAEKENTTETLANIASKRGFLRSGGELDLEKTAIMVIDEFRAGKIGQFTLDMLSSKETSEEQNHE